jgi:hypothetical protein
VIDMVQLAERLRSKAPGAGPTLESNEYALQMLRFPYRQVFGDPDDMDGTRFYDLDRFEVQVSASAWAGQVQQYLAQSAPRGGTE